MRVFGYRSLQLVMDGLEKIRRMLILEQMHVLVYNTEIRQIDCMGGEISCVSEKRKIR